MKIIGIDPGAKGGIAWLENGELTTMSATTSSNYDMMEALKKSLTKKTICYLEDCRGVVPGQRSPKAIAGPHYSFGFFEGLLLGLGVPFERLRPKVWQKPFKLPTRKSAGDTAKKRAHQARAKELYPRVKIIHATADAVLIAEFGRRLRAGELA